MPPKVSIVIPTFNHAAWIAETLDSALGSDYPDFEIIVADDGSTDRTPALVADYAKRHPQLKYHRQTNRGLSAARNFGIQQSTGKYILPLDADDLIDPTYLTKAAGVLEQDPSIAIVYCKAKKFGVVSGEWDLPDFNMPNMLVENCIFCTAMYRRTDYDTVGGYSEDLRRGLEDWDFWLSLLAQNPRVHRIDQVLFHYRIRSDSMTSTTTSFDASSILKAIIAKHAALYAQHLPEIVSYARALRGQRNTGSYRLAHGLSNFAGKIRKVFSKD